jgi:Lrp/AsnC family transcriptional regulator, leucine-responsive regulatory protein
MINNVLDETDRGILNLLQKDARIFHKEMAVQLHKSVTAIHTRIRRMEAEGYIRRYTVIVDHKKVGRGLIAYTHVTIKKHSRKRLLAFQAEVVKLNEVLECFHMTGKFDFLLRIAIRDMDEYNEVLLNKLSSLPHVGKLQSSFVMSETKNETAYLVGAGPGIF